MTKLNSALKEIERLAQKYFPLASIKLNLVRHTHLYLRIIVKKHLFLDIYINIETGRKTLF